jgi:hypothetical protein
MTRKPMTVVALVGVVALAAGGCAPGEGNQSPDGLLGPEEAFDVALSWLRDTYPGDAPATGLKWTAEDVDVVGPGGEPLVGAADKRIYSGDWDAMVSWAVVAPEYLQYAITLKNGTGGWYWEGYVAGKGGRVEEETPYQKMSEGLALELAAEYVAASPTYLFDGIDGSLRQAGSRKDECAYCWSFGLEFVSTHAGYGDRTGQMFAEVITPHFAVVSVQNMQVTSAVMDEQWDMMSQSPIITETSARFIAEGFVRSCPTFVFDGIPETVELVETLRPGAANAWVVVFRFESRQAGYGDRTGQVLAQVITPHEAHITVQNNVVVSAVMDEKWDMLAQKMLQ